MVLAKRILLFSVIFLIIAAITVGLIYLIGGTPDTLTNKGVFV